jgi:hypothetical protein
MAQYFGGPQPNSLPRRTDATSPLNCVEVGDAEDDLTFP